MGRKKKLVNNSVYPQHVIERFARCVIEDIRADFAKAEVQAEFKRWMEEQEKGAAEEGCSFCYIVFFLRGPLGLDSGRIGTPLGKYCCSYLSK